MFIRSLLDNTLDKKVTYSYCRRGLKTPYFPDKIKEFKDEAVYDKRSGKLFYNKPVSWDGPALLDMAVDIRISCEDRFFADHVTLEQGIDSQIGSIKILTETNDGLKVIGKHLPESGKTITDKKINIPVNYFCDNIIVRLEGAYENIELCALDVLCAWDIENTVFPEPESIVYTDGGFKFNINEGVSSPEGFEMAAKYFCKKHNEKYGTNFTPSEKGRISFIYSQRDDESFEIEVTKNSVIISAGNLRTFLYAADALTQISGSEIKCCRIEDKPFMNFRGVHFALPSRCDIPFLKKMVENVFVPMRYNSVFIQVSGAMAYDNYPEINKMWLKSREMYEKGLWPKPAHYDFIGGDILTKDEVRELCSYIRSFGLDVIPEVQSWAHTQYITTAYPHLAENAEELKKMGDLYDDDARPATFYSHCMCPLHEEYYKYTFGILDEVLDVFKPERYVHMGHDEIYDIATCEKCRKMGGDKVYTEEVTRLNDYLKSKGLTMMIWADMLQEKRYPSISSICDVPKDIIMLDFTWYFHVDDEFEDNLLKNGFKVMIGNLYSSHFKKFEKRIRKGLMGGQISTWIPCNELYYAYEGKMYDMLYTANMLWSSKYKEDMRGAYNEIVKNKLWDIRKIIGEIEICDKKREIIPYSCTPSLKATLQNDFAEINVCDFAKTISVIWATDEDAGRVMWTAPVAVGTYEIVYEDNSVCSGEILNACSIYTEKHPYGKPLLSGLFRHEGYVGTYLAKPVCGKSDNGEDYTHYNYHITNPNPDKKISKFIIKHSENTDVEIKVYGFELYN